jgi:hypothetical protein
MPWPPAAGDAMNPVGDEEGNRADMGEGFRFYLRSYHIAICLTDVSLGLEFL